MASVNGSHVASVTGSHAASANGSHVASVNGSHSTSLHAFGPVTDDAAANLLVDAHAYQAVTDDVAADLRENMHACEAVTDDASLSLPMHASTSSHDDEMEWAFATIREKGWVGKTALALRPAQAQPPRRQQGSDDTPSDPRNLLVKIRSLLLCMQHIRRMKAARVLELRRRFLCGWNGRSTPFTRRHKEARRPTASFMQQRRRLLAIASDSSSTQFKRHHAARVIQRGFRQHVDWQLHMLGDSLCAAAESHLPDHGEEVGDALDGYDNSDTDSDCDPPPLMATMSDYSDSGDEDYDSTNLNCPDRVPGCMCGVRCNDVLSDDLTDVDAAEDSGPSFEWSSDYDSERELRAFFNANDDPMVQEGLTGVVLMLSAGDKRAADPDLEHRDQEAQRVLVNAWVALEGAGNVAEANSELAPPTPPHGSGRTQAPSLPPLDLPPAQSLPQLSSGFPSTLSSPSLSLGSPPSPLLNSGLPPASPSPLLGLGLPMGPTLLEGSRREQAVISLRFAILSGGYVRLRFHLAPEPSAHAQVQPEQASTSLNMGLPVLPGSVYGSSLDEGTPASLDNGPPALPGGVHNSSLGSVRGSSLDAGTPALLGDGSPALLGSLRMGSPVSLIMVSPNAHGDERGSLLGVGSSPSLNEGTPALLGSMHGSSPDVSSPAMLGSVHMSSPTSFDLSLPVLLGSGMHGSSPNVGSPVLLNKGSHALLGSVHGSSLGVGSPALLDNECMGSPVSHILVSLSVHNKQGGTLGEGSSPLPNEGSPALLRSVRGSLPDVYLPAMLGGVHMSAPASLEVDSLTLLSSGSMSSPASANVGSPAVTLGSMHGSLLDVGSPAALAEGLPVQIGGVHISLLDVNSHTSLGVGSPVLLCARLALCASHTTIQFLDVAIVAGGVTLARADEYALLRCVRLARCALSISIQRRATAVAKGGASSIEQQQQQHVTTVMAHANANSDGIIAATNDVTATNAIANAVTDTMHAHSEAHADVPTGDDPDDMPTGDDPDDNMAGSDNNDTDFRIGDRIEVYWTKERTWFAGTNTNNTDTHHNRNAGRKLAAPKLQVQYDDNKLLTHSLRNTQVRHITQAVVDANADVRANATIAADAC